VGPDVAVLRRSREYRLLFTGQTMSFAGSMITYVAMPYQAYRLSGSSLVVGLLSVTELVPMVAAALIAVALPGLWRYDARSQPGAVPGREDQPAVAPRPEPSTFPSGP
jgi:hypothetical protein